MRASVSIVGLCLVASGCAARASAPEAGAPARPRLPASEHTLLTEAVPTIDGQSIYVENNSSDPIVATSIRVTACVNISSPCTLIPLRIRIEPGARIRIFVVRPADPEQAYSYRYSWTWSGAARPPAPEPAAARVDTVRTRIAVAALDSLRDTTLAASLQEARERADRAAARVDTIIVRPDTLRLRVGEAIEPLRLLTIEARTARGERVAHFAPMIRVADRGIAQFTATGLVGRRPGLTWLVVSTFSTDSTVATRPVRAVVWVVVAP